MAVGGILHDGDQSSLCFETGTRFYGGLFLRSSGPPSYAVLVLWMGDTLASGVSVGTLLGAVEREGLFSCCGAPSLPALNHCTSACQALVQ